MPPKKKGGGKKGGSSKAASDGPPPSEVVRFFPQAKALERYKRESEELSFKVTDLQENLQIQMSDQRDVLEHYEREIQTRNSKIEQLSSQLKELTERVQDTDMRHSQDISKLHAQMAEQEEKFKEREKSLMDQLDSLHAFREIKPKLEEELSVTKRTLEEERVFYKEELLQAIRKFDVKEALVRQELEHKLNQSEAELEQRALQKLDAITKSMFAENKVKKDEINFLHAELKSSHLVIKRLQQENQWLSIQCNMTDNRRAELFEHGQSLQQQVEQQGQRLEEFKKAISKFWTVVDAKSEKIKELNTAVAEKDDRIVQLQKKMKGLLARKSTLGTRPATAGDLNFASMRRQRQQTSFLSDSSSGSLFNATPQASSRAGMEESSPSGSRRHLIQSVFGGDLGFSQMSKAPIMLAKAHLQRTNASTSGYKFYSGPPASAASSDAAGSLVEGANGSSNAWLSSDDEGSDGNSNPRPPKHIPRPPNHETSRGTSATGRSRFPQTSEDVGLTRNSATAGGSGRLLHLGGASSGADVPNLSLSIGGTPGHSAAPTPATFAGASPKNSLSASSMLPSRQNVVSAPHTARPRFSGGGAGTQDVTQEEMGLHILSAKGSSTAR